jgi:hypothetical protein
MSLTSPNDPWINTTTITSTNTSPSTYTVGPSIAGQVLTSNGSSTAWASITSNPNLLGSSLNVKGTAEFEGDVIIKGKSIGDSLERIEERLAILRPNKELEKKWDELRKLREAYVALEKDITEKELIWNILKK